MYAIDNPYFKKLWHEYVLLYDYIDMSEEWIDYGIWWYFFFSTTTQRKDWGGGFTRAHLPYSNFDKLYPISYLIHHHSY